MLFTLKYRASNFNKSENEKKRREGLVFHHWLTVTVDLLLWFKFLARIKAIAIN